jgi:hypothetical protein
MERCRGDSVAVGHFHRIQVPVHLVLPVLVTLLGALGWLGAEKPEHLSFRASHDHTGPAHLHPFGLCGQYTQRGGASDRRGGRLSWTFG